MEPIILSTPCRNCLIVFSGSVPLLLAINDLNAATCWDVKLTRTSTSLARSSLRAKGDSLAFASFSLAAATQPPAFLKVSRNLSAFFACDSRRSSLSRAETGFQDARSQAGACFLSETASLAPSKCGRDSARALGALAALNLDNKPALAAGGTLRIGLAIVLAIITHPLQQVGRKQLKQYWR